MVRLSSIIVRSVIVSAGLAACGDNARPAGAPDAALPDAARPDAGIQAPGIGLAVITAAADFLSSGISLIDPATQQVSHDGCIGSSSTLPAGMQPLTTDLALPTHALPGDPLVVVARDITRKLATLTWVDPATCTAVRQLDVSTGFAANPHDVIGVSPTKAYVTRFERNDAPSSDGHDAGDDLLIIDPSVPAITGRIDLSSYAVAVAGSTIQARPDTAILINGTLYVALDSFDAGFGVAGHGRLVAIDTATDQVTGTIDLLNFKNCNGLSYQPITHTLAVACGGAFRDPDQVGESGVSFLDLDASPPVELYRRPAALFGGTPLGAFSGTVADGAFGYAITASIDGDQLWTLDVAAGTATKLGAAVDGFALGAVAIDPVRDLAYLPDASRDQPGVRVYNIAGAAAPAAGASITTAEPPRGIAWY